MEMLMPTELIALHTLSKGGPVKYIRRYRSKSGKWIYVYPRKQVDKKQATETLIRNIKRVGYECITKTGNEYEMGIVIDSNGIEVFRKKGERNQIQFLEPDFSKLMKGNLVHNHPGNSNLSNADFIMSIVTDLSSIVAVTETKLFKYSPDPVVKKRLLDNVAPSVLLDVKKVRMDIGIQLSIIMSKMDEDIRSHLTPKYESGEITANEASDIHMSMKARRFVKEVGGTYEVFDR